MLVAKYWAEARLQHKFSARKQKNSQVTIKRLGWSNTSQAEADQLAQQRAHEAMQQVLADPDKADLTPRRDRSHEAGYNGADGLPIREEIVDMQGDVAITRNSYGALCLNTPNVMFIDIDDVHHYYYYISSFSIYLESKIKVAWGVLGLLIWILFLYAIADNYLYPWFDNCSNQPKDPSLIRSIFMVIGLIFMVGFSILGAILMSFCLLKALFGIFDYFYEKIYPPLKRIQIFAQKHPQWSMNVYRTAAGYRILVLHQEFDPADERVWEELKKLGIDPVYERMCLLQKCFRARLTPKPWRMGIQERIPAGRLVWHAHYAHDLTRIKWVNRYENKAENYATCHLIKRYGGDHIEPENLKVMQLHDELCKVHSQLPLA